MDFDKKNVLQFSRWIFSIYRKKVFFCLVVGGGVTPPYTLSGPTTKKTLFFMCVFPYACSKRFRIYVCLPHVFWWRAFIYSLQYHFIQMFVFRMCFDDEHSFILFSSISYRCLSSGCVLMTSIHLFSSVPFHTDICLPNVFWWRAFIYSLQHLFWKVIKEFKKGMVSSIHTTFTEK